jgi:tetratricopeptide (TPR) repeat protein
MFRFILCAAAALLTLGMATLSAAADDRETCAEGFRRDESIAACSRLLKRNPKDVGIYKLRADHYWLKKDYDGAIADYDEALRLAPKAIMMARSPFWIRQSRSPRKMPSPT